MSEKHVIDGVTYVEVDRKAEVGEKVIVIADWYDVKIGKILDVISPQKYGFYDDGFTCYESTSNKHDDTISYIDKENYHVLEPIEEPTPDIHDLLANLARRVSLIENFIESQQRLNDSHSEQIDTLFRNGEKLAEELATKTHELDDKVEMALDDIVTLDERTQPKEISNEFLREIERQFVESSEAIFRRLGGRL